jgi:hypothetical protein
MIQSTSHTNGYNRLDALANNVTAKNTPVAKSTTESGDSLSSANTNALREALNNTPEVRADVVKRGRELAADSNYPPRVIIAQLAKLMLESNDPSEKA